MKKQQKRDRTPAVRRFGPWPWILVVIAAASVAVGAATVIARQRVGPETSPNQVKAVAEKAAKRYVTVKVAGQGVQVDSQTGQIKPLTAQEAQQLAAGLKGMLNQSTEGLVQVKRSDGSVSMDLDGHFQNVTVARKNEDGSITQSCVDNPQAAASFFGIDPQLLGVQSSGKPTSNPARLSPAKSTIR